MEVMVRCSVEWGGTAGVGQSRPGKEAAHPTFINEKRSPVVRHYMLRAAALFSQAGLTRHDAAARSGRQLTGARHCRAATTAMAAAISTVGVTGQRAQLRNAPTGLPKYWLATTA
ncbi:hypothetical protein [Micromonospora sp. NPDC051006]|uniref:hypothetical protein n=1 Tax=Micromonospora sp. NPDC051006 TaxID=3364283 RepID=UPI00379159C6